VPPGFKGFLPPVKPRNQFTCCPKATPVAAKELLNLGRRAAVDQALSRQVGAQALMRAGRGIYIRPVESRFGTRSQRRPRSSKVSPLNGVRAWFRMCRGANELGLTTQVPVREVYLNIRAQRRLKLGAQVIEIRQFPAWQLVLPGRPAGAAISSSPMAGAETNT